ncbi:1-deoxy-D-xylulose-5-phosphate reductoisomerase [Radiobacillus kanasensis]|uniref:1-deoxy-D-xylulose-5-phosphate reductoisomerase n=1 Tax=Radiobacillus kanasensis TaxID=2844358 RepID=UPI001E5A0059|nr:1-deoxy-D-xylulose-5-phosphate reductoisomerase [Radiobacillus kanasensis]UFU01059.1 1-deoxy-D-xylulose-5-phosphate reductoisomerase [Radiobacillus kanasensis]
MKKIAILGATGSVGLQTFDVVRAHPELFQVHAMAFGRNVDIAIPLIREFSPKRVVVQDVETKKAVQQQISNMDVLVGNAGMVEVSVDRETDVVVNAVLGSVGLEATLAAIRAEKQIAFANKETLVTAGHLVMEEAKKYDVTLLPVDSEHSAIFQALNGEQKSDVHKLILTGSGGSFRDLSRDQLADVSIEDALKHPNWSMGAKITIDSATMMNKGLEVIEAHWLFDTPYEDIDVILHKESVIHSMVEFKDNSVIAQLGTPDMRGPIQYALTYPSRQALPTPKSLNLMEMGKLHFQEMSFERFPCLKMAYEAGKAGGTMTTVLNAANEVAVALFLQKKISFLDIERFIEEALQHHNVIAHPDLETILAVDVETRARVTEKV